MCDGNRYSWVIEAREGCRESYGDDSVWDQERAEGACSEAWDECNSGFASTCCTQPEGPSNIGAYCENQVAGGAGNDRACDVQGQISAVQQTMQGIRDIIALFAPPAPPAAPVTQFQVISGDCAVVDGGMCIVSPNWPEDYEDDEECELRAPERGVVHPRVKVVARQFETEGCCDKLSVGDERFGGDLEEGPDEEVSGRTIITWSTDFSAPSKGWKVCAEDIPPPPPPPPPAPGAPPSIAPPLPPAPAPPVPSARKPTLSEIQCAKLTGLVNTAASQIATVRGWAERDGIVAPQQPAAPRASFLQTISSIVRTEPNSGSAEARDPDLTFAMRQVLAFGDRLNEIRNSYFCTRPAPVPPEDDDDDDYDDDVQDANATAPLPAGAGGAAAGAGGGAPAATGAAAAGAAPAAGAHGAGAHRRRSGPAAAGGAGGKTGAGGGAGEDDEEEEAEEPEEEAKMNGKAVGSLLDFEDGMQKKMKQFEANVHPHGNKWWRYRYEYTLVESLVLAWAHIMLYLVMYLLHGVSFFGKFKFYNIGLTQRLYRYAWGYIVFHGAALMIMAMSAYVLYMPWGENNIFDYGAKAFHKAVDGQANIPFLGYSWFIMVLEVCFQLFVCFLLYAVFIVGVIYNFQKALEDWKSLHDAGDTVTSRRPVGGMNLKLFNFMHDILRARVQASKPLQDQFIQAKLILPGVAGPGMMERQWKEFKVHLYLTDALGLAIEYMVEISLKAHTSLALCSLLVALLAHHYQVAFMYFLPIFLVAGFLLFAVGFVIGAQLRKRAHNHDHDQPLHLLTTHFYCRSVQIVLYCVFFSFSRLLLSADIFMDYPRVYLASVIGLLLTLIFCCFVAGEIIKETLCAIVLPPQIPLDRFRKNLQQIVHWYTLNNCHECGVRQFPQSASYNKDWASDQACELEKPATSGRSDPRQFSWRA
jgi:hypothetical protein